VQHRCSIGTDNFHATVSLFLFVMLQIYAWGAWASLEMRLARTRRSAPARRFIVFMVAIAAVLVGLGSLGLLGLRVAAMLTALQTVGRVSIQLWTLWRRGAKMPHTIAAVAFGAVLISLCGWFIQPL
jgi:hypothetical protein